MSQTTKVAVSLPLTLFQEVERARKKTSRTRSAAFQDALRLWLRRDREEFLVREYEAGYRRDPERREEVQAAQASALKALAEEDW